MRIASSAETGLSKRRGVRIWPVALGIATVAWLPIGVAWAGEGAVDFGRDVLPILSENCLLCHGPDPETRQADLRLDLRESALRTVDPIIVPGNSDESELLRRIESDFGEERMPPPRSGKRLTDREIEILRRWIDEGASWGVHWAFEPPKRVDPPLPRDRGWVWNPIDRFILTRLEETGLAPSPEADRETLIRRLSLGLIGLPPSLEEVDAFRNDDDPLAYERLVDRLLASPHHGELMAQEWLDAARYADTNGYQNDFARTMWPWRDWVISALNRNQPYDRFLFEQIAGDLIPGATLEQRVATGFLRNNRTVTEAGSIDEEWRIENAVDRVETTATVFLGLTMGCARCHDHKYDPISQSEFYQFMAFFNSVHEKGVYTEQPGNVPPLVPVPRPEDERALERIRRLISQAEGRRDALEESVRQRYLRWQREVQRQPAPREPLDWSLRCGLGGNLRLEMTGGGDTEAIYRGSGTATWVDSPTGKAIQLEGHDEPFLELGPGVSLDRSDRFSFGGWVRPGGDGVVLSKMDDESASRGYDLLVQGGRIEVHLVHSWPDNAIKVVGRRSIPRDRWSHVWVTYDGSSKASGLKLWVNGQAVEREVQADSLSGTFVTTQPLRIGRRSRGFPFRGEVADVRIYRRALEEPEVRELAESPWIRLAQRPAEHRTNAQERWLEDDYRERVDGELRASRELLERLRTELGEVERKIPTVMIMEDLPSPRPTYLLKRGRYDQPDTSQVLEPEVPSCVGRLAADAPRNRLGLARWLISPTNPLTARVVVNRIWQHHFGTGLVETSENFGLQGERPSHPELLDWLAAEFVRSGWDLKGLHRLIVTSATFRQDSRVDPQRLQRDPVNRLLSRGPRLRLPAEQVRDLALTVSGLLERRLGGPSVKPYQPEGLWEELAGGAGEGPYVQDHGPSLYRRSLYIYRKRTVPHPVLATFDAPSREVCQVRRPRTNTPLQALELLNDVTYLEAARHLAEEILGDPSSTPEQRLATAFRRVVGRQPTAAELAILARCLDRSLQAFGSDPEAAARFIQQGERPPRPGLSPSELAAYLAVSSVILNLDETMTRE
jgi:hypothetical protein